MYQKLSPIIVPWFYFCVLLLCSLPHLLTHWLTDIFHHFYPVLWSIPSPIVLKIWSLIVGGFCITLQQGCIFCLKLPATVVNYLKNLFLLAVMPAWLKICHRVKKWVIDIFTWSKSWVLVQFWFIEPQLLNVWTRTWWQND